MARHKCYRAKKKIYFEAHTISDYGYPIVELLGIVLEGILEWRSHRANRSSLLMQVCADNLDPKDKAQVGRYSRYIVAHPDNHFVLHSDEHIFDCCI